MKLLQLTKRMLSGNFKLNIDRRKKTYQISEEEKMAQRIELLKLTTKRR